MTAAGTEIHSGVRLGYRPELDGLRAIAVTLVIAFHYVGHRRLAGGFLGVDLFFVLSGFLITRLLLEERAQYGRIRILVFYGRRAARLLPALGLVVAWVAIDAATVNWLGAIAPDGVWPGVVGALLYVTNWASIAGHDPGALGHTWSLAVEEQFYLVWPACVVAALRWRATRGVAIVTGSLFVVAVAQTAIRSLAGVSAQTLYGSTDAHGAIMLMAGCAMAATVAVTPSARAPARLIMQRCAAPAALIIAALVTTTTYLDDFYYRGGFVLAAGCFVAFTGWALDGRRSLCWPPLVYVGKLSYGLYLWHYPMEFAVADLIDQPWPVVSAVALAATAATAVASYHLFEMPVRRAIGRRLAA